MKGKTPRIPLILTSSILALMMLTLPVLAQYNVTITLYGPQGEPLYKATLENVDNMTLMVPEPLWLLINETYGTTTFTAPFTLNITLFGVGPGMVIVTLEVISDPEGFTVTFVPMEIPDLTSDGEVDIFDLVKIARKVNVHPEIQEDYDMFLDLNFDLAIDLYDLVEVARNIEIAV